MATKAKGLLGESWGAWFAVLVGVLAISAQTASSFAFSVLMKPMVAEFGWSRADFASAMTVRMFTMTMAMMLAGHLSDRFGPRLVLFMGALIIAAGTAAISAVHNPTYLFPIMALIGPGQAAVGSVAASALVLRLFRNRRGLALGVLNGGDNLLTSSVPLLAAFLLERVGWRGALLCLSAIYTVLAIFFILGTPREATTPSAASRNRQSVDVGGSVNESADGFGRNLPWRDARLWVLIGTYVGIYAFITSVQLHLHAFQTDSGLSAEQASRILSVQILVGAIGAPFFGWVAERTSSFTALLMVVIGLALTSIVLWTGHGFETFMAWAVIYGIVNSGVVALLALVLSDLFGAARIGSLMGVAMMFCMGSTMLANLYTASIFDHFHTYIPVWQSYSAAMLLILAPVVWLWRRRAT